MELVRQKRELSEWQPNGVSPESVGAACCSFIDTATTAFGRATHYNTKAEQQAAEIAAHNGLFQLERDLYTVMLALPGITDRSQALGLKNLLATTRNGDTLLTPIVEREVLYQMLRRLRPDRMLKAMEGFRLGDPELGLRKANNARSRKLVLRTLLNAGQLQWWSVRYKKRIKKILVHAWGEKIAGAISSILRKPETSWTEKEYGILHRNIGKFVDGKVEKVHQCVGFVLGLRKQTDLPLLKAFKEARENLEAGKKLPVEVLEGIRSTYHKDTPHAKVLELTAKSGSMTKTQKVQKQREAAKAGVKVEADLSALDATKLYLYAFEMGMTDEIAGLLKEKAGKAASLFPTDYEVVGIVVDASASMAGSRDQKLRPLAATLALRDMLAKTGKTHVVEYVGGPEANLGKAHGDTDLSTPLVSALEQEPDVVFVLSDGYENAPAGRFSETVEALHEMGCRVPIYHLNPVFAAEAGGIRDLSPKVPALPVQSPTALGTTFIRGMIAAEPVKGINALIGVAAKNSPYLLTGGA